VSDPLVNLGDLAKPLTTFIKKLAAGIGCLYEPRRIIMVAKAEAEASKIRVAADIENTEMEERAIRRLVGEETKKQANIEGIIHKAILCFDEEKAEPEKMDDDWVAHFFDKCRNVSNEEMQRLWAKVLAGEANKPGSFSRKTVNLIADLNTRDANLFTKLCCFCWAVGPRHIPLIFGFGDTHQPGFSKEDGAIYNRHGVCFDTVRHLEALGLVQISSGTCSVTFLGEKADVFYNVRKLSLKFQPGLERRLPTGHVLLTQAGEELAPYCGSCPVEGFFELVRDRWPGFAVSTSFTILPNQDEPTDSQPCD
jgi:hypothetical protein